ncbi:hypothetical protein YA0051_24975 [Pseudomonas syringae]|nr:hypothetical protein [Pseudomonas syringae]MBI6753506.1 hypothetical protein [Pseudomonas syringae]MBI6753907.1 hypothetical protein [Pseudomonas syringae]MBI6773351.1 hypothetical protein [Pseudomonas syringae]MBI6775659.1 hypothetical protein [Pseudomonas syringae]
MLRDRLFGRKSEQTVDPQIPQLAPFNEAERVAVLVADNADEDPEDIVAPVKRRGNASRFAPTCRRGTAPPPHRHNPCLGNVFRGIGLGQ